jgi:hypothetical protein
MEHRIFGFTIRNMITNKRELLRGGKQLNCYNQDIKKFDLVVVKDAEFDLTFDRVYVVRDVVGVNLIQVKNDKDNVEVYTTEYFRFYEGERIQ